MAIETGDQMRRCKNYKENGECEGGGYRRGINANAKFEEDHYRLLRMYLPNAKLSYPERGWNFQVSVDRVGKRS